MGFEPTTPLAVVEVRCQPPTAAFSEHSRTPAPSSFAAPKPAPAICESPEIVVRGEDYVRPLSYKRVAGAISAFVFVGVAPSSVGLVATDQPLLHVLLFQPLGVKLPEARRGLPPKK